MRQPEVFSETRVDVMHAMMTEHPFAAVVSHATGSLSADHVPLVVHSSVDPLGALHGHIAVSNPLFRETSGPIEVLCLFQGPQTYVTPAWYASKKEHGKVVPTWNYVVVHARGTLTFKRDPEWLMRHLHELTDAHEQNRPQPWAVTDAPDDYVSRMLRGLVGFEIIIDDLQGTWKMSQNKTPADRSSVERGLAEAGATDLADLVQNRGA